MSDCLDDRVARDPDADRDANGRGRHRHDPAYGQRGAHTQTATGDEGLRCGNGQQHQHRADHRLPDAADQAEGPVVDRLVAEPDDVAAKQQQQTEVEDNSDAAQVEDAGKRGARGCRRRDGAGGQGDFRVHRSGILRAGRVGRNTARQSGSYAAPNRLPSDETGHPQDSQDRSIRRNRQRVPLL